MLMAIPGVGIWGLVYAILVNIVLLTGWYYVIVARRIGYRLKPGKLTQGILVMGVVYVLGQYLKQVITVDSQLIHLMVVAGFLFVAHALLSLFTGLTPK